MKMFMNPATGSVAPASEWRAEFEAATPEEWGGENFEDAGLVEVVENREGTPGYDPDYGDWRPMGEDAPSSREISLDNGLTLMSADEATPEILERKLWDVVVAAMDEDTRERVHRELAPCTELEFLRRYLEVAAEDLIIG